MIRYGGVHRVIRSWLVYIGTGRCDLRYMASVAELVELGGMIEINERLEMTASKEQDLKVGNR